MVNEGIAKWELGIMNKGNQNLDITELNFTNPVFYADAPVPPFSVSPNDTTAIAILFSPQHAITVFDTLSILCNDPINPVSKVTLQGTGDAGPFTLGHLFWNYQVPDHPATSFDEFRPLALKSTGDVTGDGISDVVLGSGNYWLICLDGASSGFASEVWRFTSYISNYSAGDIGNTNDLPPQQKALAIANDLNDDGAPDIVIGTGGGNEHVYALSGKTGGILWQFGTDHPDSFGLGDMTSVYVNEDFNNDNINDVIATGSASGSGGLEGRRTVYCFNGLNGQILWQQFLGCFIRMAQTVGDINGNGSTDVVAGTGDGQANAYSIVAIDPEGPTGPTLIWNFPIGSSAGGGKEVIRYDIENETSDVIAGAYFGQVYRIDGETGTQVWNYNLGFNGIYHLSIIEDVDDDGYNDILVSNFTSTFYCLSGSNGNIIWSVPFGNSTWSAEAIPDLNGDGYQDVVAASKTDKIYILDGKTGTILHDYAMNSGMLQGATLASILPDIDNNNSWEILGASDDGKIVALSGGTAITSLPQREEQTQIPKEFALRQNFPNPFNPVTTIHFSLPENALVNLAVYNLLGQKIAVLLENRKYNAGNYSIQFNGENLPSGIYLYKLESTIGSSVRKMILLK